MLTASSSSSLLDDQVGERTAGDAAERQEAVHDVTQEVKLSQQVGAVGSSLGEHRPALPVRRAQLGVADIADVHQKVQDIPQSTSCGVRGQRSEVYHMTLGYINMPKVSWNLCKCPLTTYRK